MLLPRSALETRSACLLQRFWIEVVSFLHAASTVRWFVSNAAFFFPNRIQELGWSFYQGYSLVSSNTGFTGRCYRLGSGWTGFSLSCHQAGQWMCCSLRNRRLSNSTSPISFGSSVFLSSSFKTCLFSSCIKTCYTVISEKGEEKWGIYLIWSHVSQLWICIMLVLTMWPTVLQMRGDKMIKNGK